MKVALFADKLVGLETLKFFQSSYIDDLKVLVVTQENELTDFSRECNIPYFIYDESTPTHLESFGCDIGILAWWPKIIKQRLIAIPKQGFINFHPSYLPYNRGKHYNFWAIVENVPFGVTIHRVNQGIDSGDIITQTKIDYDWTDTGESLFYKAQSAMIDLFKQLYPQLRNINLSEIAIPQNMSEGSFHYAEDIESACKINLEKTYVAKDLINLLRARTFTGHPSCLFVDEAGDEFEIRIKITRKDKK